MNVFCSHNRILQLLHSVFYFLFLTARRKGGGGGVISARIITDFIGFKSECFHH